MNEKRILVTGGAGFLGSHLSEKLLNEGHSVICLDNLFTGKKSNIADLLPHPRFEFIRHDIIEPILLEVDEIYHLACPASPIHYQYNPIKTVKTAVVGTLNMLGLAKRIKAKLLLASTSEVYGDPQVHPQPETYWGSVNPIGPRSCYDEGKRLAETLCYDYHRQSNVDIRIVRIFNTYGPKMALNDGRVMSNLIVQALQNQPLTLYGDGSQTRSFCYVDDLLSGMTAMMNNTQNFLGPVNIGNDTEITIQHLAQMILKHCNSQSEITYKHLPQDDPKQRQPDLTLAKKTLNWAPKIPLEVGLETTVTYFKKLTTMYN